MSGNYYNEQLYPLQDRVLALLAQADTNFYLTGGTAVGRFYLNHRYSDDLDFFLNYSPHFEKEVDVCEKILRSVYGESLKNSIRMDTFARFFIGEKDVQLKIEFVNDVLFRVGKPQPTPLFVRTDIIPNIISNKICALSRKAAKYIADIWFIALNYPFNWKEAILNAQQKDAWVDETEVLGSLKNFDLMMLSEVNWVHPFDIEKAQKDMEVILKDILWGEDNHLLTK